MPGVYGDQIAFFPELLRGYRVYTMQPKLVAGYQDRTPFIDVWGYVSRNKGGKEGIETELRTANQTASFWTPDEIPSSSIKQGMYVVDDGDLLQFVYDNNFAREAGFAAHALQLVPGPTDKQVQHTKVNLGEEQYN